MSNRVRAFVLALVLTGQLVTPFLRPANAVFPAAIAAALPLGSAVFKTAAGQFLARNAINIVGATLTGLAVLYSQNPDSPNPLALSELFIPYKDNAPSQYAGEPGTFYNTSFPGSGKLYVRVTRFGTSCTVPQAEKDEFFANVSSFNHTQRPRKVTNWCSEGGVVSGWIEEYYFVPNSCLTCVYESSGAIQPEPSNTPQVGELSRSETGFTLPADSDFSGVAGGSSGRPIVSPSAIQTQYLDGQGNPAILEVTRNGDASTTITEHVQNGTNVDKTVIQVSSSGAVSSVSSSSSAGALSPVATVSSPTQTAVSSPTVGAVSGGAAASFPSDYARAGEASAAAAQVVTGLLEGEVVAPVVDDATMPWFGDTFEPLNAFQINTSGATCPVWQFDALDENFYIDHHCTLIQDFNALFFAMFTAFWALLGIRTVMEA